MRRGGARSAVGDTVRRRSFALFILLTACGGGETPPIPPDCQPSCTNPPPFAPITLRIMNGTPVAGARVLFRDEAGRSVDTVTDLQGIAQTTTDRLTTVTAINPFGPLPDGRDDVRTLVGAAPFDSLQIDKPPAEEITVDVVAPDDPQAARYELHTTCGRATLASETGQVTLRDCNGFADVVWMSIAADGTPLRAITKQSLPVEDGGTIALSNNYLAVPEHRIDYSGVDDGVDRITARAMVRQTARGITLARDFEATITSGVGTARVLLPNEVGAETIIDSRLARAGEFATHGVFDVNPPSTGTREFIDVFNALLATVTVRPQLDGQEIAWSEFAFAPVVLLESSLPDAPPPEDRNAQFIAFDISVERGGRRWRWKLIAPHSGGPRVRLPELPAEFGIEAGDTVTIDRMLLAKSTVGYGFQRPTLLSSQRVEDMLFGIGSGRLVYQEL